MSQVEFYMITIAAKKANMHPQTLRMYEMRGLIQPKRSEGNTRLYCDQDIVMLRKINYLTTELGMNLSGVEAWLQMEFKLQQAYQKINQLENQLHSI